MRSAQLMEDVTFVEITSLLPLIKFLALLQYVVSDNISQQQGLANCAPITQSLHKINLAVNFKLVIFLKGNSSPPKASARHVRLSKFLQSIREVASKKYVQQDID